MNKILTLDGLVALRNDVTIPEPVLDKALKAYVTAEDADKLTQQARYQAYMAALNATEEGQRLARIIGNALESISFMRSKGRAHAQRAKPAAFNYRIHQLYVDMMRRAA